jgi:hypothetical protein
VQSSVRITREVEVVLDLPMLRPWGAQHFKLVSSCWMSSFLTLTSAQGERGQDVSGTRLPQL